MGVRSIDAKAKLWTTSWTWTQLKADEVMRPGSDGSTCLGWGASVATEGSPLSSKQRGAAEMGIMQAR